MIVTLIFLTIISTLRLALLLPIKRFKSHPASKSIPNISELQKMSDIPQKIPLWTILVPIYRETERDIKKLRTNLFHSKYPYLEIIFLCEEVDAVTTHFLKGIINENNGSEASRKILEKIFIVPRIEPFTKPKACNYGLEIARGEYVTIYDIEDIPHPHQIHAALYYFQKIKCDCVQFPLNFIHDGLILSGWQKIDYTVWYFCLIPMLQKLNSPIPLGGTSNHFKTNTLREIGGWKSYNVTEDAELGIRMKIKGLKVHYVEKYETLEPTLCNIINLMNQRVRWCKGHFLTFFETFIPLFLKSPVSVLFTFFLLSSSTFTCLGYIYTTLSLNFLNYTHIEQKFIMCLLMWGIALFFINPLMLLWRFPELRTRKLILCVLFYNVYIIFYTIPTIRASIECLIKPGVWYKTAR